MLANFNVPASVIAGAGSRNELANQVKRLGAKRVFLVTDAFLEQSGLAGSIMDDLAQAGIGVTLFSGVQPDPTVQNVRDGLAQFKADRADIIVALGGGSPMDAAKAISILTTNGEPLSQYMGYHKIPNAGVPLITIPTTSGTGSEVTKVTVISDTENDVKMMILDAHLLPTVAIVDPELAKTMPAGLTAHVGVDTLTHAIEAYVSRKANALTDPIALSCIRLVAQYLYTAWSEPDNMEARTAMAFAATQGGMAFSNSSVCLVHGMSRPIGALFHLPHGLSNAVLLPAVTRFSISGAIERYATIARTMDFAADDDSDEGATELLMEGLDQLNTNLEVPRLRECRGMAQDEFEQSLEKMARDALASGSPQNNPVVPDVGQIVELYQQAW